MKDLEQELHEAFDAVVMPQGLKEKTMSAVFDRLATEDTQEQESPANDMPREAKIISVTPSARRDGQSRSSRGARFRNFGLALAACLALVAVGFGGFKLYSTETAYIGIDINPSIELGINCFDRVISQRAVNDDGELALSGVSLVGKTYDEAMAALSENETFMTSVSTNGYVEISVTSDNNEQTEKLSQESDRYIATWPCEGTCHSVSSEEREAALAAGMGVNRYRAALELMELDPNVTLEECRSMTMRVLRDRIVAAGGTVEGNHGHEHGTGQGQGNGMGNGQGNGQGNGNGAGNGQGMGNGQGAGNGTGQGAGNGNGEGAGAGNGQGMGAGSGQGSGSGSGQGSADGTGQGTGAGGGQGQGMGSGQGAGGGNGQGMGAGQGTGGGGRHGYQGE